jgi:hypothetical protein
LFFLESWNLIYSLEKILMLSDISLCVSLLFCKMRLLISKPCHAQCSEQEGCLPLCFINVSYFLFPSGLGGFCWKLLDYKHIILTVINMLISYLCWLSLSEYFYQPLLPLPYAFTFPISGSFLYYSKLSSLAKYAAVVKLKNIHILSSNNANLLSVHNFFEDDVTWLVYSLQVQKINEEQKKQIRKTERALKVAEVCEILSAYIFLSMLCRILGDDFNGSLLFFYCYYYLGRNA